MQIRVLDKLVANQIAAGEVVERPYSVVKELVENAIDSGAKRIEIDIERGGLRLIRVRDNGCGIPKEDLPNALARHATSKIRKTDDLREIMSLGFRGEALASIAAVSRLSLSSRMAGHRSAWRIQVEGNDQEPSLVPVAHNDGTTVEVRDLFYNTPARRKFLRTEKTEFNHIEEMIRKLALSRFDIGISFKHNKRSVFEFKPAHDILNKEQRLAKLYGSNFMRHAVAIDMERNGLQLTGWIAVPEFTRNQADLQSFFVNARVIKDKLISHAIRQAYGDKLAEGRYPAYALYLNINPGEVDVNVHPTKHEVRFSEARLVHDFITSAIQEALAKSTEVVNLKFDYANTQTVRPVSQDDDYAQSIPTQSHRLHEPSEPYYYHETAANKLYDSPEIKPEPDLANGPLGRALAQVHEKYIIAENSEGLILLNVEKAQQILIYQRLLNQFNQNAIVVQPLLIPETIAVSEKLLNNFDHIQTVFNQYGIEIDRLNEEAIVLRKLPKLLRNANFRELLTAGLEFIQTKKRFNAEKIVYELAQHGVNKQRNRLSPQEMNILLRDIEKLENKNNEGIWQQISLTNMAKLS
ncbi:MAG: DNA mismatch repair endonuclease MutL [Legionellales bacterium]|nr:DNA mismatch repair endonuclease MutL [Legionellales bacterium]